MTSFALLLLELLVSLIHALRLARLKNRLD
jgi:hypothetical protein